MNCTGNRKNGPCRVTTVQICQHPSVSFGPPAGFHDRRGTGPWCCSIGPVTIIVPFLAGSIAGPVGITRFYYGEHVGFWLGIAFMPIVLRQDGERGDDRRFYLYLGMCSSLAFLYLGGIVAIVVWMLQFVVLPGPGTGD